MPTNLQQFIKFIIVSWINTAVDFGTYAILTRGFDFWADHLAWANALALTITMINSYLWSTYWVFPPSHRPTASSAVKFTIVSLSGLAVTSILFWVLLLLGANEWWTKLFLMLVLFAWNFVGNKWWVYTTK